MKKTSLYIVLITSLLVACNKKNKEINSLITIDVTQSYPKKEIILQDIFDIEYIPLETTEEFITSGIPDDIIENRLLVSDAVRSNTGNIFYFGKDGSGIKKINRFGQGAEEYIINLGCVLDTNNKDLFVNSYVSRKIMVYDWNGNYKRSLKQKESFFYDKMDDFSQDYLICHDGYISLNNEIMATRNYFMLVSKLDGSIKEISIPYKKHIYPLVTAKSVSGDIIYCIYNNPQIPYKDGFLLMEASSDTIYHYTRNQVLKPFIARIPSVQNMETEIFLYPGVQTDRYSFMQTVEKVFDNKTETGFPAVDLIYDWKEKAIYECKVYNDDFIEKESMTLVFDFHDRIYIKNREDVAFMKKLDAPDLVEAYEKGKLKGGRLKEIAAALDEEDNPVIMIAKYKR